MISVCSFRTENWEKDCDRAYADGTAGVVFPAGERRICGEHIEKLAFLIK